MSTLKNHEKSYTTCFSVILGSIKSLENVEKYIQSPDLITYKNIFENVSHTYNYEKQELKISYSNINSYIFHACLF